MRQMYNIDGANDIQMNIMNFISNWSRNCKTPVPKMEIVQKMESDGFKESTIQYAIDALVRKQYIRKSLAITRITHYVQLRTI